ncbi:AY055590 [Symbiodinium necroappetens]|uniref:subtilisin n=1 Tax=Symbiodinium necroappetens TaxID=1628268 RepID=A0A813BVF3_9DINO|nr:AY055590 [Symbiodinium necroappetens]
MYSIPLARWYQKFYGQEATEVQVSGVSFDSTTLPDLGATESNLDIQMMVGVGPNIPTYVYGVPKGSHPIKDFFAKLDQMTNPPLVNSLSVSLLPGAEGPGNDQVMDGEMDLMFLAAKGITVVVASGDDGAGYGYLPAGGPESFHANSNITGEYFFTVQAPSKEDCNAACSFTHRGPPLWQLTNNKCGVWLFQATSGACTMFSMGMPFEVTTGNGFVGGPEIVDWPMAPTWPTMSPWVTSVGSTAPWRNGNVLNQWMPERATNLFGSGGGFMCPYQDKKTIRGSNCISTDSS